MSRIEGRSPNASGQMRTAGCAPVAGWINAASQVPSAVLISTFVSTMRCCADASIPDAATMPAPTVNETNSRRVMSLSSIRCLLVCVRSYLGRPYSSQQQISRAEENHNSHDFTGGIDEQHDARTPAL